MKEHILLVFVFMSFGFFHIRAQGPDSLKKKAFPIRFSGYAEAYYAYDFGNPASKNRPGFFYSFNRHNELNLNLAMVKATFDERWIRGNAGLMLGTYPNANLAAEPGLLKNIWEANIGVRPFKKLNLWIDAGILPSHIGFESAIGADCWNVSRSMLADNSPYVETGIKIEYKDSTGKFTVAALYLNGWQQIQIRKGFSGPAFGTRFVYSPNARFLVNWSTFAGKMGPDSVSRWRFFNNFYTQLNLAKKWDITAGFDIGIQAAPIASGKWYPWYSPVFILRYTPFQKMRVAARGELYMDPHGVVIATGTANGFQTLGYSVNLDYLPRKNVLLRAEFRGLSSRDAVYKMHSGMSSQNYAITASVCYGF